MPANAKKHYGQSDRDAAREDFEAIVSRRDFVSAAAKLAAFGVLLNMQCGDLWAASEKQVMQLLDKALSTGSMQVALDRYGRDFELTGEQARVLGQISQGELHAVTSIVRLGFNNQDMSVLANAARVSSDSRQLMERADKLGLDPKQLEALGHLSAGELDAFNPLVGKLARSGATELPVSQW